MIAWIFADDGYLEQYHAVFAEYMDYFESGRFAEMFDGAIALISPYVAKDPTAFCTYDDFLAGSATLREFCLLRAESIQGQLDGTIASTSDGQAATGNANFVDASALDMESMGSNMMSFRRARGSGGFPMRGGWDPGAPASAGAASGVDGASSLETGSGTGLPPGDGGGAAAAPGDGVAAAVGVAGSEGAASPEGGVAAASGEGAAATEGVAGPESASGEGAEAAAGSAGASPPDGGVAAASGGGAEWFEGFAPPDGGDFARMWDGADANAGSGAAQSVPASTVLLLAACAATLLAGMAFAFCFGRRRRV
jgi:hypothetical protein